MIQRLSLLVTLMFLAAFPITSSADDNSQADAIRIKLNPYKGKRPKAPSIQEVSCFYYSSGTIHVEFLYSEGDAMLSTENYDTGELNTYSFDSSYPTDIFVGEIREASIEIQTEAGHLYTGTLTIQ